ncbi:MAG TPA: universal stress protein [Bacteroidales bacterium]
MPENLVTLTTLTYMRAQLLCAQLESNGITCFINSTGKITESPAVIIKVHKLDLKKSKEIFEHFIETYGQDKKEAVDYMRSVRRILVPVDFTPHSENAAVYALLIAETLKAEIKLLYAYLDPGGTPQTYLESYAYQLNIESVIKEVEEESEKSLQALVKRLKSIIKRRKLKNVEISCEMLKGGAVNAVLSEIEEFKPGLLVIGTRGSELEGLRAFGSVTSSLISKVDIPMIAVPKNFDASRFKSPKKVLFATNFEQNDVYALQRLVSFVKPFKTKIFCVHAALNEAVEDEELKMKKIKKALSKSTDNYEIEYGLLETVDVQQGLEDFISERKIDVLALTRHNHNYIVRLFKPSLTKKFLFQSQIPLFIFQTRM